MNLRHKMTCYGSVFFVEIFCYASSHLTKSDVER